MKLIRLLSDETVTETEFENHLQETLLLNSNSKIGLKNLSLALNENNIDILTTTNSWNFKTKEANPLRNVTLTLGSYSKSSLIEHLKEALNKALTILVDNNDLGYSFLPILTDNKVDIQLAKTSLQENPLRVQNVTYSGGSYTKTGGSNTTWNGYAVSSLPFTHGCGKITTSITNYVSFSRAIIGLSNQIEQDTLLFDPTMLHFGLFIESNHYVLIYNGQTLSVSSLSPAVGDTIELALYDGKYHVEVKNAVGDIIFLDNTAKTEYRNFYQVALGFRENGVNSIGFGQVKFHASPYHVENSLGVSFVEQITTNVNYSNELLALRPSNMVLQFPNIETANTYGYSRLKYTKTGVKVAFTADAVLGEKYIPEAVLVELMNIDLNSFDYSKSQQRRRNILGIFPVSAKGFVLSYQTDNPLMLDLRNQGDLDLNSIRVRITDTDEQLIAISQPANLTLVIE